MATCRSCGAPIEFIRTPEGHYMPVDPKTVWIDEGTGNDTFVTHRGEVVHGTIISDKDAELARKEGEILEGAFVPHWATCKEPWNFRKKKGASK